MAFDISGIDDLMTELDQIDIDRIAPKMLEESVGILKKAVQNRMASHVRTGDMINSLKAGKCKRNAKGYLISVTPTGKDRKGVSNMEKMIYMEFGTSHQPATPVLGPAVKESEDAVKKKMQEVLERELKL